VSAQSIFAQDLLALASELAGRGIAPVKHRAVDLRCAVSRAYYAVFHEITAAAAEMLWTGTARNALPEEAFTMARWISHNDVSPCWWFSADCQELVKVQSRRRDKLLAMEADA
jgi:hypothetical protein